MGHLNLQMSTFCISGPGEPQRSAGGQGRVLVSTVRAALQLRDPHPAGGEQVHAHEARVP